MRPSEIVRSLVKNVDIIVFFFSFNLNFDLVQITFCEFITMKCLLLVDNCGVKNGNLLEKNYV